MDLEDSKVVVVEESYNIRDQQDKCIQYNGWSLSCMITNATIPGGPGGLHGSSSGGWDSDNVWRL